MQLGCTPHYSKFCIPITSKNKNNYHEEIYIHGGHRIVPVGLLQ